MSASLPQLGNLTFRDPLLRILGIATQLTPNVFIPFNDDLIHQVIADAGFDLDNLAQYGTPEQGWNLSNQTKPASLVRRVALCYRFSHKINVPLTVAGGTRGQWALTEAGVEAALDLLLEDSVLTAPQVVQDAPHAPIFVEAPIAPVVVAEAPKAKRKPNVTSNFLGQRISETGGDKGTLMSIMRRAVIKHLPVSHTAGIVDDHIQNCFCRMISRDSLANRLEEGGVISDHALAMFAVRAGFTDIRDSATDPVCRELYGARTEKERDNGVVLPPSTDKRVTWSTDEGESSVWLTIADDAAGPEDIVTFQRMWERLENTIRVKKPHVSERYINILRMRINGCTMKDIAEKENVSPFRAAALMAEVRRVLKSAVDGNSLAI